MGACCCFRSDSIEEWELDQPEGKEVECLLDRLKQHFSSGQKEKISESVKERERQVPSCKYLHLLGSLTWSAIDQSFESWNVAIRHMI